MKTLFRNALLSMAAMLSATVLAGPRVTVIGDSYSTYSGSMPSGYANYYTGSNCGVTSLSMTWWSQFIASVGGSLEVNNSWSGSLVCNKASGSTKSFIHPDRLANLGSPNVIVIFGGTNDSWQNADIGDSITEPWDSTCWTSENLQKFRPAFAYLLNWLQTNHPQAEIYVLVNSTDDGTSLGIKPAIAQSMVSISEHYGVTAVELSGVAKTSSHPNAVGMRTIARTLTSAYNANHPAAADAYSDAFLQANDPSVVVSHVDTDYVYAFTNPVGRVTVTMKTGSFVLTCALVVGGGGAGGWTIGGGGGGGAVEAWNSDDGVAFALNDSLELTVGAGGGNRSPNNNVKQTPWPSGEDGEASSLTFGSVTLDAPGGGGGAGFSAKDGEAFRRGRAGACGGGGAYNNPGGAGSVGGNGGASTGSGYNCGGGGGGGASGANGGQATSSVSGAGGAGVTSDITGETLDYGAGGGGGGGNTIALGAAAGGASGGAGANANSQLPGENALTGRGGGGGGGSYWGSDDRGWAGGDGGSGCVILRFTSISAAPLASCALEEKGGTYARLSVSLGNPGLDATSATATFSVSRNNTVLATKTSGALVRGDKWSALFPGLAPASGYEWTCTLVNNLNEEATLNGTFDIENASAEPGTGGVVTESGADRIHVFNENGTFSTPAAGLTSVRILVVGGGGAGGWTIGGGGGGGAVIEQTIDLPGDVDFAITVGAGGIGDPDHRNYGKDSYWNPGQNGSASSFIGSSINIVAPGGGGGSGWNVNTPGSGANGGGANHGGTTGGAATFTGGHPGGTGAKGSGQYDFSAGGGGGMGGPAGNGTITKSGDGGAGVMSDISGTNLDYGAGGGGGAGNAIGTPGAAGGTSAGVGGSGGTSGVATPGAAGTANRGGGGGGGGYVTSQNGYPGGNGGSGTVILRYRLATDSAVAPTIGNFNAEANGSDVAVSWCVQDAGYGCDVADVHVEWGLDEDHVVYSVLAAEDTIGSGSYVVHGLLPGRSYVFRVTATNASDETGATTYHSVVIDEAAAAPETVDALAPVFANLAPFTSENGDFAVFTPTYRNKPNGSSTTLFISSNNGISYTSYVADNAEVVVDDLPSGQTYLYYLESTCGTRIDRTPVKSFYLSGASVLSGTANLSLVQRYGTFTGELTTFGAGASTELRLQIKINNVWTTVKTQSLTAAGPFNVEFDLSSFVNFGDWLDWRFQIHNATPSQAGDWTSETLSRGVRINDNSTYTWKGVDGAWNDAASWTCTSSYADVAGWPRTEGSTVEFPAAASESTITLDADYTVKTAHFRAGSNVRIKSLVNACVTVNSGNRGNYLYFENGARLVVDAARVNTKIEARLMPESISANPFSVTLEIINGGTFTTTYFCTGGETTQVIIDNSTLEATSGYAFNDTAPGGTIVMRGANPSFIVHKNHCVSWADSHVQPGGGFLFYVPENGYAQAPVRYIEAGRNLFAYGQYDVPARIEVAADSPAAKKFTSTDGIDVPLILVSGTGKSVVVPMCNFTGVPFAETDHFQFRTGAAAWIDAASIANNATPTEIGVHLVGQPDTWPRVKNLTVVSTGAQGATLSLSAMAANDGVSCTAGVAWRLKGTSEWHNELTVPVNGTGWQSCEVTLTGLDSARVYEVKALARSVDADDNAHEFSDDVIVQIATGADETSASPSVVIGEDEPVVTETSATFDWTPLFAGAGASTATATVEWGETVACESSAVVAAGWTFGVKQSYALTGLLPSHTYYVRVKLVNNQAEESVSQTITVVMPSVVEYLETVSVSDGLAQIALRVKPHGQGSLDLHFVWGETPSSLAFANEAGTAPVADTVITNTISGLKPGKTYYAHITATRQGGDTVGVTDDFCLTMDEHLIFTPDDVRTISIASVSTDAVTLSCGTSTSPTALYVAYGPGVSEDGTNDWAVVTKVADVAADATSYVYNLPAAWGTENAMAMRFFFISDGVAGLVPVDYIQSTGKEYIKTGIHPSADLSVSGSLRFLQMASGSPSDNWDPVFGIFRSTSQGQCLWIEYSTRQFNWNDPAIIRGKILTFGNDYEFTAGGGDLVVSGSNYHLNPAHNCDDADMPLFAFYCPHKGGYYNTGCPLRLYSFKIRKGATTVRDFVPMRQGSEAGLFDRISQSFFGNQSGKGAFVAGPDSSASSTIMSATDVIYYEDKSLPEFGNVVADVSAGDVLTVSGTLAASVNGACQLQLYVGTSVENLAPVGEAVAVNAGGDFELSANGLVPGERYSYFVEATCVSTGSASRTPIASVVLDAGVSLGTVSATAQQSTVTVNGTVSVYGAGATRVWLRIEGTDVDTAAVPVNGNGSFTLTGTLPGYGSSYGWMVVASNETASSAYSWGDAKSGTIAARDYAVYTWKTSVSSGAFGDSANWTSSLADCSGAPMADSMAIFPSGATGVVSFVSANTCQKLIMYEKSDITFRGIGPGASLKTTLDSEGPEKLKERSFTIDGMSVKFDGESYNYRYSTWWGHHLKLTNGAGMELLHLLLIVPPGENREGNTFVLENKSTLVCTGWFAYSGTEVTVDDSTIIASDNSNNGGIYPGYWSKDASGERMIFKGVAPTVSARLHFGNCLTINDSGVKVVDPAAKISDIVVSPDKPIPNAIITGGQARNYKFPYFDNHPYETLRFSLDPASPMLDKSRETCDITVVDWPAGIDTNYVIFAEMPRKSAMESQGRQSRFEYIMTGDEVTGIRLHVEGLKAPTVVIFE